MLVIFLLPYMSCVIWAHLELIFSTHTVAAGDGEDGAGPVPVAGTNSNAAQFKLLQQTGQGEELEVSPTAGIEDDAVVVGRDNVNKLPILLMYFV